MINLRPILRGKLYSYNSLFGFLRSKKAGNIGIIQFPKIPYPNKKAQSILEIVHNPYLSKECIREDLKIEISSYLRFYANILIWCHKHFLPGIWLFSKFRFNIFKNAVEASDAFYMIHPENQHILCFPRSIFTATTSKQFKENGALFIGALLPSNHMHSWVIENGTNSCRYDNNWTNYTPIAMMI